MDLTHLFDHLRRRWNANTTPEPPRHPTGPQSDDSSTYSLYSGARLIEM